MNKELIKRLENIEQLLKVIQESLSEKIPDKLELPSPFKTSEGLYNDTHRKGGQK